MSWFESVLPKTTPAALAAVAALTPAEKAAKAATDNAAAAAVQKYAESDITKKQQITDAAVREKNITAAMQAKELKLEKIQSNLQYVGKNNLSVKVNQSPFSSIADSINANKSLLMKVALATVAASTVSGVGVPIAGVILVGIFVVSQALNQHIKNKLLNQFLNDVLLMLIQLDTTYSLITDLQKAFNAPTSTETPQTETPIHLDENIQNEVFSKLNKVIQYIFSILPDGALVPGSAEAIARANQGRLTKTMKFASRVYKRNFDTEKVQKDILRDLTMVNSFFFALYTQCMFQLEAIKLNDPIKFKEKYTEVMKGAAYRKLSKTATGLTIEEQKAFDNITNQVAGEVIVARGKASEKTETEKTETETEKTETETENATSGGRRKRINNKTCKKHRSRQ
jgi:hypothetical protein